MAYARKVTDGSGGALYARPNSKLYVKTPNGVSEFTTNGPVLVRVPGVEGMFRVNEFGLGPYRYRKDVRLYYVSVEHETAVPAEYTATSWDGALYESPALPGTDDWDTVDRGQAIVTDNALRFAYEGPVRR